MAPSRYDWKIVDWDVKPQHNQHNHFIKIYFNFIFYLTLKTNEINTKYVSLGINKSDFLKLWINQKTTTLVTYNLEYDSIKLSQFVSSTFELRKKE